MLIKTRGIVLKTMRYRESGMICDLYTEDLGLRSYILSGVYSKSGKSKAAYFHPLSILKVVAYEREHKDLQRLKEFELEKVYQQIPFDFLKGSMSLFMSEVLRNSVKERSSHTELFAFLEEQINQLEHSPPSELAFFPIQFLIGLAEHLGFGPTLSENNTKNYFDLREGLFLNEAPIHTDYLGLEESAAFYSCLEKLQHNELLTLNRATRLLLLDKLIHYFRLHTDHFKPLKSIEIIGRVLR